MTSNSQPESLYSLTHKNLLLGISGGIAAYKCAELVRRFKVLGANVRVVMTDAAREFVTPLTLHALSGNPVYHSLLDADAEAGMGHIELARWADLLLVAPATANTLSRLANGEASDLLSTLALATKAPLILAPAMNQGMWLNAATQKNCRLLRERGAKLLGPAEGEQACGDIGPGRMLEVELLVTAVAAQFETGALAGKKVVITAGPTIEALDPVRFLSNRSSGKMGYALAQAAVDAGARVVLVSGPVSMLPPPHVERIAVESALQMYETVMAQAESADVVIAAAAVADYRPKEFRQQKIKKGGDDCLVLELIKNPDIVASVAQMAGERFVMGFAAETQNVEPFALSKLEHKQLDAIVANDVARTDIGFNSDDNAVKIFSKNGEQTVFEKQSKQQIARNIVNWVAEHLPPNDKN